jgi:hypothetical protein
MSIVAQLERSQFCRDHGTPAFVEMPAHQIPAEDVPQRVGADRRLAVAAQHFFIGKADLDQGAISVPAIENGPSLVRRADVNERVRQAGRQPSVLFRRRAPVGWLRGGTIRCLNAITRKPLHDLQLPIFRGLLDMLVVSVLAETRAKDAIASEGEGAVAFETKTASAPMAAYVLFHTNLSA